MKTTPLIAVAVIATACSVEAQYTEIDISAQANANIQTYSDGTDYQLGGTQLNVAGVPFGLSELDGNAGTTGVVQSPDGSGSDSGPFSFTFAVPAGTYATTLYSLMNTAFGAAGVDEGSLVVTGTGGETATLDLVEGVNIRDHYNDGFVNTLSDPTVVSTYFNGQEPVPDANIRLDRQELELPSTFAGDTIASITFEGTASGAPDGSAFLAGLTLAVPDVSLPLPFTAGVVVALLAAAGINRKQVRLATVAAAPSSSR
jgi:hypothetical protein